MLKEERAAKAVELTKQREQYYGEIIKTCVRQTALYDDESLFSSMHSFQQTESIVEDLDSVSAIFRYATPVNGKIAVLNFASYRHPGGGYINGSMAQEEALCAESILYNVLRGKEYFYNYNNLHTNCNLYTNRALYTPDILFERDGKKVFCDVITCAAPNRGALKQGISDKENSIALESRIRFVLKIAATNKVQTLILGAYGCGVFAQDPEEVATLFKENIGKGIFHTVVYAIPGGNRNLETFQRIIK